MGCTEVTVLFGSQAIFECWLMKSWVPAEPPLLSVEDATVEIPITFDSASVR